MTDKAPFSPYLLCTHHADRFALEEMVNELGNEGAAQERYKMTQLQKNICSQTVLCGDKACRTKPGWLPQRHSECQLPKLIPDILNILNKKKNPNPRQSAFALIPPDPKVY